MKSTNSEKKNLIGIQDRYMSRVQEANAKWSHRNDGGHSARTRRAARREAERGLTGLGFTQTQVAAAIRDAQDMIALEAVCQ